MSRHNGDFQIGASFVCDLLFAIFVHLRFAEPQGPEFEDAIVKLRKLPAQALSGPVRRLSYEKQTFANGDNQ